MRDIDPRVEWDGADPGDWIDWQYWAGRYGTTPERMTAAQRRAVVVSMRNMVRYALWRDGACRQDGSPMKLEDLP